MEQFKKFYIDKLLTCTVAFGSHDRHKNIFSLKQNPAKLTAAKVASILKNRQTKSVAIPKPV